MEINSIAWLFLKCHEQNFYNTDHLRIDHGLITTIELQIHISQFTLFSDQYNERFSINSFLNSCKIKDNSQSLFRKSNSWWGCRRGWGAWRRSRGECRRRPSLQWRCSGWSALPENRVVYLRKEISHQKQEISDPCKEIFHPSIRIFLLRIEKFHLENELFHPV